MAARTLTSDEAQQVFASVTARGDEIAFRYILEGCECRAQLMIEHLERLGIDPGRAWAVAVGRDLTVSHPTQPRATIKWRNHTAPTVAVEGVEHGVLVIDPSLSWTGPTTLTEWAGAMRTVSIEVSSEPLTQAEILEIHRRRALAGGQLDAVVFYLELGRAPIPEVGGSGFRLDIDPPQGVSAFAREQMQKFLDEEKKMPPRP